MFLAGFPEKMVCFSKRKITTKQAALLRLKQRKEHPMATSFQLQLTGKKQIQQYKGTKKFRQEQGLNNSQNFFWPKPGQMQQSKEKVG